MPKKIFTQKDYTTFESYYQLKLPLNIDYIIPANDSVRLLSQFIEEMDLKELFSTYFRIRKNQASPRQLLKIMIYAYMNCRYSSREIELSCKRDINFMYLLEDSPAPDHTTIARFRSQHFSKCSKKILAQMSNFLLKIGEISGEAIFIDGTKIEACANKYTFVWKKAVTKNLQKLLQKIIMLVEECEELYDIKVAFQNEIHLRHLKKLHKKLYKLKNDEKIEFVYGSGKRKSKLQKSIEALEEYTEKLKEYTQKIHCCGNRNSYSKTDKDATFMRMKEDAMLNGQLKPAYNLQHGVDSEYITWLTIGPEPTDTTTLIPFLKSAQENLDFKYRKIVADAGYESEENYKWIDENEQITFIKPANYEISKTRKYQKDISKAENMIYDIGTDTYMCQNDKKLKMEKIINRRSKTGYTSEKTIYLCEDCSDCKYKKECIKSVSKKPLEERVKKLEISKLFNKYRQENLERIISEEGCQLRMNRSIQVEGSFGNIKEDMKFRRYLCRGKENVLAESIMLALAHNVNKFHKKIQNDKIQKHLHSLK